MAVKASITITISKYRDCDSITRYYKLQASTAAAPAIPTTLNPSGWSTAEPTYTSGSTNTLYYTDCYVFSDGTFQYTDDGNGKAVKSSSYEAAKEAYNKAQAAQDSINDYISSKDIIIGTQTESTRFWTGVSQLESLQDGDEIIYWLPYATVKGAAGDKVTGVAMRVDSSTTKAAGAQISTFENSDQTKVWLDLTLKDGTMHTGWIPCYYGGTTRLTTHYGAGNAIRLVYRVNANINGVQYTGFFGDANYNVNDNTYDRIRFNNNIKVKSAITAGQLIVSDDSGYFKLAAGSVFKLDKPILYCGTTKSAGATDANNNYLSMPSVSIRNNTNSSWTATKDMTLYLVGVMNGNNFTVDSTTPFTTTVPTTEDGKYYISLGYMYSTYQIYLYPEHPIFKYINGQFKNIAQIAYEAQYDIDTFDGRNILLKTRNQELKDDNNIYINSKNNVTVSDETIFSCQVFKSSSAWADIGFCLGYYIRNGILKSGDEVTYSIWVKTDDTESRLLKFYCSKTSGYFISNADVNSIHGNNIINTYGWIQYYYTFMITNEMVTEAETNNLNTRIECTTTCTSGTYIYWAAPKLEKGNKATGWIPAIEDTDSDISRISSETQALTEELTSVKANANYAKTKVDSLNGIIESLVKDDNGMISMTHTGSSIEVDMTPITDQINSLLQDISNALTDVEAAAMRTELLGLIQNVQDRTAYINASTDNQGRPIITLGANNSPFKVEITNESINFLQNGQVIAYANGQKFYNLRTVVQQDVQIGVGPGFIWKTRESGNMGLTYVSS